MNASNSSARPLATFCPTVIIGLGGTGYGALLKLKKRLVDVYGNVPPIIKLLSIDTTENSEHREETAEGISVSLDNSELYQISITNLSNYIKNRNIQEWWPSEVNVSFGIERGAGQVRARGRLGLFAKSQEIFAQIQQAIGSVRELRKNKQALSEEYIVSQSGDVAVYIICSLAGGTGSGTFFDVACMARNGDAQISVTGVFALPRVFRGKPFTENIESNAYGALKEIEYLWSPDPVEIDYGSRKINIDRAPFDLVFLIDGVNEKGHTVSDQNELQNLMADGLFVQIASQIGVSNANASDNIKAMLSTAKVWKNRFRASYCSFGVASLTLPISNFKRLQYQECSRFIQEDLLTDLASSERLKEEADVLFAEILRLQENILVDDLSKNEQGVQIRSQLSTSGILFGTGADRHLKEKYIKHFSSIELRLAQSMTANYSHLETQICTKLQTWWRDSLDKSCGLSYCHHMLTALSEKLEKAKSIYQTKAREFDRQQKKLASGLDAKEQKLKEACSSILPIGKERKIQDACASYADLASQVCQYYINSKRYDKAAELIGLLIAEVSKLLQYQEQLQIDLQRAIKEFEQVSITSYSSKQSLFEHIIQRFDIEEHRPKISFSDLSSWLRQHRSHVADWVTKTMPEIKSEIEGFVNRAYQSINSLSVEEALRRSEPDEVGKDLAQLWELAHPLWRYDESKIPVEDVKTIHEACYYGTADADNTVLKDSRFVSSLPNPNVVPSIVSTADPSRITLFRVRVGVPLFALDGIEMLKQAYDNPSHAFKHLHKDWPRLPDILPSDETEDAMRWFALGIATQTIRKRLGMWSVILQQETTNLDENRSIAFAEFKHKKNMDLVRDVQAHVEQYVEEKGFEGVREDFMIWIQKLRDGLRQQVNDPSLQAQLKAEIEAINHYLREIDPSNIS